MPRRGGQRVASVEHDPSELRVGLGLQRRDHEVAAQEPDRVYFVKLRWTCSALNLDTVGVQLEHRR
ncbi:hypothetical protein, partial [Bifidobacterium pseudocatenulatum]|uniref:hypothetical protein n=1 Tax=Bifidobacterium pseudocatenulatum TaxID=28026 RepID=UPI0034A15024